MTFFDSHAHYWDRRFQAELAGGDVETLLDELLSDTVEAIVNVGTTPATSRLALAQARRHRGMYAAVGIHPTDSAELPDLEAALVELSALIAENRDAIVALGEIGLDYHWEGDHARQVEFFRAQMRMAEQLELPVVIHDREAHGDVFDILCEFPGVRGVLHSYSGSAEMARELIRRGYYISFSGTVSFTNAARVRAVAAELPRERVLIETDCPYLAPHPHRGKLNHSGLLPHTNRALAEALGLTEEACARQTAANARRLFFGESR